MTTCSRSSFWMSGSHIVFGNVDFTFKPHFRCEVAWRVEMFCFLQLQHVVYRQGFFVSRWPVQGLWSGLERFVEQLNTNEDQRFDRYVLSLDFWETSLEIGRCCLQQSSSSSSCSSTADCSGKKSILASVLQSWFSALAKTWGSRHRNDPL